MARQLIIIGSILWVGFILGCGGQTIPSKPAEFEGPCSITLIRIPQGKQMIGTDNSRAESYEHPATVFVLDYVLYMGATEVTFGQYREVMGSLPEGIFREECDMNTPAYVGYEEAVAFCRAYAVLLEQATREKWKCRLPTEAEWEYAACYGRDWREDWWPTEKELDRLAYYGGGAFRDEEKYPQDVGFMEPSPLGLYDMFGNEFEFCDGWLTESVVTMLQQRKDKPNSPSRSDGPRGNWRPMRGGDNWSPAEDCRPSRRHGWEESVHAGFRIVALP